MGSYRAVRMGSKQKDIHGSFADIQGSFADKERLWRLHPRKEPYTKNKASVHKRTCSFVAATSWEKLQTPL